MRYSKEHKTEVRRRLLDGSAQHAKLHGFAASGVDTLASAAGVTSGSLYKHFNGKSELFTALIQAELERTADLFANVQSGDVNAAEKVVAAYLSPQHMLHPEQGCPLPALTAEVARADTAVRAAFDEGLHAIHARLEPLTGSDAKAWALLSQCVGAVMLARGALAPELQRVLLESAKAETASLLGNPGLEKSKNR